MRVFILDNGLHGQIGHHFAMVAAYQRSLAARGIESRIWAHRECGQDVVDAVGARRVFRRTPYSKLSDDPLTGPIEALFKGAKFFAHDCETAAQGETIGPDDLIFLPSALNQEIHGIDRWLTTLPSTGRPKVVVNVGFDNSRHGSGSEPDPVTLAAMRLLGKRLVETWREPRQILTTCGAPEAEHLSEIFTYPVRDYPLAHDYAGRWPSRTGKTREEGPLTVSFLGHAQRQKGFHLLPAIVRHCEKADADLRFFVQVSPASKEELWSQPESMTRSDRVELHHGELDRDTYFDRLDASDIALMPYDPSYYSGRTSGVLTEALAFGKVCVVPKETWMARQLEDGHGTGGAFREFKPDAIARTLLRVTERFDPMSARAATLIEPWRALHSTDGFVDRMLANVAG